MSENRGKMISQQNRCRKFNFLQAPGEICLPDQRQFTPKASKISLVVDKLSKSNIVQVRKHPMEGPLMKIPINREKQETIEYQNEEVDGDRRISGISEAQTPKKSINSYAVSNKMYKIAMIGLIICSIYIIQDIFTRQDFASNVSKDFIVSIQSWSINQKFLFEFSRIVSTASFVVTGFLTLCVIIFGPNLLHTINYLIFFSLVSSFLSILKLIYNDPRPYMEFSDILGEECSAEYGDPSGHAMINLYACLYGLSVLGDKFPQKHKVICGFYAFFLLLVGFSRCHLGMHGLNQIFLGWVYAVAFFFLFRIVLFDQTNALIIKMVKIKQHEQNKPLIVALVMYILFTFMVMGIFIGVKQTYQNSNDAWNQAILSACKATTINSISNKYLYNKCLIDGGIFSCFFSIFIAIILSRGSIEQSHLYGYYQSITSIKQRIKRYFTIFLVPASIFILSTVIFLLLSPSMVYLRYFVQMNGIPFICAFIYIYFSPIFLKRFQLSIQADFLLLPLTPPFQQEINL